MSKHTPSPWHWHDAFGRKDGKGESLGVGKGPTGDEPPTGQVTRFSFCVSDDQGFVVAHCTNALVTMSSDRSEANARLIAAAPELLAALKEVVAVADRQTDAFDRARAAIAKAEGIL